MLPGGCCALKRCRVCASLPFPAPPVPLVVRVEIVQNVSDDGASTDVTFTVVQDDLDRAKAVLEERRDELAYAELVPDPNVAKISVIGVGMRSHVGVAQQMFSTLAENGINIQVISTSEIKVSVLIEEKFTEQALRALHTAYDLDAA